MMTHNRTSQGLKSWSQRDDVIEFVAQLAREFRAIRQVRLFGSRARRDHVETSDYDFLVHAEGLSHDDWLRFLRAVDDSAPTLRKVDCVLATTDLDPHVRAAAEHDGVVIYER